MNLTTHRNFIPFWMGIWITLWVILSGCFATLFIMGFQHYDYGFSLPCNFLLAVFILQFLPTFLAGYFTMFWEEADLYYRQTQAYVGMREQKQPQPAYENLLLEYPCLPALIIPYIALQKKHYKVALISLMALVQRLLPIIAAGSVTLGHSDDQYDATVVWVNPISCGSTLAFILLEFPLIFLARPGPERRLPHECVTIGDMLSWCWDSELVRNQAFDITIPKERVLSGDKLDDRQLMNAGLLWSRGKYAFGEINKDNDRADSNETAGRIRFGFDSTDRITIPTPKKRRWFKWEEE
ncbi:hypothetical protein SLS55_004791 [Diplodia seriata]|uniref:Integral membrane protein n=1 Tax=Diplodia seriata TaxID=420778 RepID=A0ABR3CKG2_9PEZI